jgi:hypothetical protein
LSTGQVCAALLLALPRHLRLVRAGHCCDGVLT